MKLFLYLFFSTNLVSFCSIYSGHYYDSLLKVSGVVTKEIVCALPDTFGSNIGSLVGLSYVMVPGDRPRACFCLFDLALGLALSGVLSEIGFSMASNSFNFLCGSACDETVESPTALATLRIATSTVLASVFFTRSLFSYMQRNLYGVNPFSMSYAIEEIFERHMRSAQGKELAEIKQDLLLNPFVRESKKYEVYKTAYPSMHRYVSDRLESASFYPTLSRKPDSYYCKKLLMQIAVNHAILTTSLYHGRKDCCDKNGIIVHRGYQGLPREVVDQVVQYLGNAPFY